MGQTGKRATLKRASTINVVDLFCGAGGFSEGFRLCGFTILAGFDNWAPAVDTFSLNHGGRGHLFNLERVLDDVDSIDLIPDSEIIIGSPPCVSFSTSNRMGNADKSHGVKLLKAFFRVVAVKRHQRKSRLRAWFFENVPNVRMYLPKAYTFANLGLTSWAKDNNFHPNSIAVNAASTGTVVDSSILGAPQRRRRYFAGEMLGTGSVRRLAENGELVHPSWIRPRPSFQEALDAFVPPTRRKNSRPARDPIYKFLTIPSNAISDHYYDSSIHAAYANECRKLKINHPYMGKMSFPDNLNKPCRTITATDMPSSREAIILHSDWGHSRDGKFRTLTVREAACLMTFPITYQFTGKRSTKWKLVGNAVCPATAAALARSTATALKVTCARRPTFTRPTLPAGFYNLNTFAKRTFSSLPERPRHARFRGHPWKGQNITVALTNYDFSKPTRPNGKWYSLIVMGTGKFHRTKRITSRTVLLAEQELSRLPDEKRRILDKMREDIVSKVPSGSKFQALYESRKSSRGALGPETVITSLEERLHEFRNMEVSPRVSRQIFDKQRTGLPHLVSVLILGEVVRKVNGE